ncbi:MAG: hypothetical protein KU29_11290 [Sulfurovum sp. FS06-10]|jgi:hypothetical protein|nr:MAG: hypothetical protein KU29_11290 [Sulfurovum sp. FS06-10]
MHTTNEKAMRTNFTSNQAYLERPDGGWPVPFFQIIPLNRLLEITKESPRISIVQNQKSASSQIFLKKILPGGIRMPHLHVKGEIILLDTVVLQNYFHAVAEEVANIEDITEFHNFVR